MAATSDLHNLSALLLGHGVLIVFVIVLAARVGLPLPASPLLVVAGGLTVAGQLPWAATLAASIAANLLGDALWYAAGRRHGHRILRLLCRISMSPDSCVRQSEAVIARWGASSLIAAKFLPGISVVAAPMAGALGMSWARFAAFELLAAALWSLVFLGLGVVFSHQIELLFGLIAEAGVAAIALLASMLLVFLAWRYARRRRSRRELAMERIDVIALQQLMHDGREPVIIDVRSAASQALDDRRIPGAIVIGLDEFPARAAGIPVDREIVLYCNCPNEVSAARAAQWLMGQGHVRVRPLAGGLDAWVGAGLPVVASTLREPFAVAGF